MKINWKHLQNQAINDLGDKYLLGSNAYVIRAYEIVLGEDFFRSAVDQYLSGNDAGIFARHMLSEVRSFIAMDYCYEIYQTSKDIDRKSSALELLRWIANEKVLDWIPEFLYHPESDIQNYAVLIIDQMMFKKIISYDDILPILQQALNHPRDYIREKIKDFIEFGDVEIQIDN